MTVHTASMPAGVANDPSPIRPLAPLPGAWRSLGRAFVATARTRGGAPAFVDSTGAALSYRQALLKALALGRVLERVIGEGRNVGVLLPPTCAGAVTNVALTLRGRVPVNLNYTANQESVDSAVSQAKITHTVTSKRMLEKVSIRPGGNLIVLEDLAKQVGALDKAWAAAAAFLTPTAALGSLLPGLRGEDLDAPATVIFTSGSTGMPKGVVLSHRNILSNVQQIREQIHLTPDDVVLGVLPLFHSFGFTVPLWTVVCIGLKGVYHTNPLDAQIVGRLTRDHKVTVILATPTFARGYLKRCKPEDFATVRLLVLGAEKLKAELEGQIRDAWGIEPMQGYGCTETGPVVSVNSPLEQRGAGGKAVAGNRSGTVGRLMPGTSAKTVHHETGAELPPGEEGIVLVKGPQVMAGYLDQPGATSKVLRDGWYETGDLGHVDEDGFLTITGRLSRFSKIGGEMVPHERVENAIHEVASTTDDDLAITSISDSKRGERLVVVHTEGLGTSPEEVVRRLQAGSLSKLCIPSAQDFIAVEEIPKLGSGKLNLRRLQELAQERLGD